MEAEKKMYLRLVAGVSLNAFLLCTSTPGWAKNPYTDGHRAPGSFANRQGNQHVQRPHHTNRPETHPKQGGLFRPKKVESSGTFVQHPSIPRNGVDQKGGFYDKARGENPEFQRPVNTPRQNPTAGNGVFKIQPVEQPKQPFNILPKRTEEPQKSFQKGDLLKQTEQRQQQNQNNQNQNNQNKEEQERQRQAWFDAFDAKYREICARTRKPNCDPPPHPSSGTSAYIESNS